MAQQDTIFFLTMTVTGFFTWLVTFGITAGVNYAMEWITLIPPKVKSVLNVLLVIMLTALVTAIANSVPTEWQQKSVMDALVALFTLGISYAGSYAGRFTATTHQNKVREIVGAMSVMGEAKNFTPESLRWADAAFKQN